MKRSRFAQQSFRAPWTIFWVGLALRIACIVIGHTYRIQPLGDHFRFGFEMGRIARSLVQGQGYANPFNGPSGPTAWVTPLYPLLMAASFKLFGIYTNAAAIFLLACNSVFSAAIAPAVYEIAARCFDARGIARRSSKAAQPVALWAAWMWAVYPAALQYAIHWIWEMSLSTCLFTWTMLLALRLRGVGDVEAAGKNVPLREPMSENPDMGHPNSWRPNSIHDDETVMNGAPGLLNGQMGTWVVFGLLWGLVALSNASLLLCFPGTMLWILWPKGRKQETENRKQNHARQLVGAVVACVVFAGVMAPWVVRNERVLHAFIPTRTNFGAELYESTLRSHDAMPWGTSIPLWTGDPEFKRFARMGEVAYSRERGEDAKARLRTHPRQFWRYTLDRFLFFWDDTPQPVDKHQLQAFLRDLSYAFLSLCGLLGLGLALQRQVPGAGLMALAFLLVPLPYYLVTVQARFRHPLEPLIAVLGVYLFRSTVRKATTNATNATNAKDAKQKRGGRRERPTVLEGAVRG